MNLTMKTQFDTQWKNWIKENLERGCDKYDIYDTLIKNEFSSFLVEQELNMLQGAKRLETPGADIFVKENFLTTGECHTLINLIKSDSRESTTTNEEGTASDYRTSRTCDLGKLKDENRLVRMVDEKICRYIGINDIHGEVIQGQWYKIGQEFKRHTDYFEYDENNPKEWERYVGPHGNRTWTFMICLNDVEEGGHTYFHEYDISMKPVKGRAIIWKNLDDNEEGNPRTMHSGLPVEKGEKFIITKWFREGKY